MPANIPSIDRATAALARASSDPRWTPAGLQFAQSLAPSELLLLVDCGLLKTAIPIINTLAERGIETGRNVSAWLECGLLIHAPVVAEHPELVELAMRRVAAEVLPATSATQSKQALDSITDELAEMREGLDQRRRVPVTALKGRVRAPPQPVTLAEMDAAVRNAYGPRATETVRYEVAAEDGVFVAQWLDGDLASDGATEAEAIANLKEAVALYRER